MTEIIELIRLKQINNKKRLGLSGWNRVDVSGSSEAILYIM